MKVELEGGLLRVTLDRPQQRNVLSTQDCQELTRLLAASDANAMLLQATGPYFCAGLEASAVAGTLFDAATWLNLPVVIAVQGPATDEGVALIACAHVAIAAQGVSFALTAVRNGVFPQALADIVSRAIGTRRATEVALTGRAFSAPDALAWGLVHQVAPAFEFDDRAEAVAGMLAAAKIEGWPPG